MKQIPLRSKHEALGASFTDFGGWEMPASWFQSVNPLAIIALAPIFSWFWGVLHKRNMEPASPVKQAVGLFLLAIGYFIIAVGVSGVEGSSKTSMFWLLSMYMVRTHTYKVCTMYVLSCTCKFSVCTAIKHVCTCIPGHACTRAVQMV